MKKAEINKLKDKDVQALMDMVRLKKAEIAKAKLDRVMTGGTDTNVVSRLRRELAVISTLMSEKKSK